MKANELRIGNWVTYNPVSVDEGTKIIPLTISCIDKEVGVILDDGFTNCYTWEEILPIPLTPEILEKIGFVRIDHINGYSFYTLSKSKKNRCHIDICPEKTSWMSYSVKHCKSVHELQNLFYSITGEELEIAF